MTRYRKKDIKGFLSFLVTVALLIASVAGLSSLLDRDTKTISPFAFSLGALDKRGEYVETNKSIYTKELIECQGLKIEPDFEASGTFQVYYYDEMKNFVGTSGAIDAKDGDYEKGDTFKYAKYCRIVITPTPTVDENGYEDSNFKIRFWEVVNYAKDYKITVSKIQNFKPEQTDINTSPGEYPGSVDKGDTGNGGNGNGDSFDSNDGNGDGSGGNDGEGSGNVSGDTPGVSCKHVDDNDDGACDKCGQPYIDEPNPPDEPEIPCEHYDNDGDRHCDSCGTSLCIEHDDFNGDSHCDYCNIEKSDDCNHRDKDDDFYCDYCGFGFKDGIDNDVNYDEIFGDPTEFDMVVNQIPSDNGDELVEWYVDLPYLQSVYEINGTVEQLTDFGAIKADGEKLIFDFDARSSPIYMVYFVFEDIPPEVAEGFVVNLENSENVEFEYQITGNILEVWLLINDGDDLQMLTSVEFYIGSFADLKVLKIYFAAWL